MGQTFYVSTSESGIHFDLNNLSEVEDEQHTHANITYLTIHFRNLARPVTSTILPTTTDDEPEYQEQGDVEGELLRLELCKSRQLRDGDVIRHAQPVDNMPTPSMQTLYHQGMSKTTPHLPGRDRTNQQLQHLPQVPATYTMDTFCGEPETMAPDPNTTLVFPCYY